MSVQETVNVTVESGAVTATSSVGICHGLAGEYKLIGLTMVPQAALAADGSNKYVISVVQGSTTVAPSLDSSSAAHVAQTAQAFTLSAAGASLEFGATDVLKITMTETGTAAMNATYVANFQKVRV